MNKGIVNKARFLFIFLDSLLILYLGYEMYATKDLLVLIPLSIVIFCFLVHINNPERKNRHQYLKVSDPDKN